MISSICIILGALVPFILNEIIKSNTPAAQEKKTNENIDKAIASHNQADVTVLLTSSLDKLRQRDGG